MLSGRAARIAVLLALLSGARSATVIIPDRPTVTVVPATRCLNDTNDPRCTPITADGYLPYGPATAACASSLAVLVFVASRRRKR